MIVPKSQCVVTHGHRTAEDHGILQSCLSCFLFIYTSTKKRVLSPSAIARSKHSFVWILEPPSLRHADREDFSFFALIDGYV